MSGSLAAKMLMGFAIGDALGVPVEFYSRKALLAEPLTDFRERGAHRTALGEWSDDTAMTVATMESIIHCKAVDYEDIMRNFCEWAFSNEFSASGKSFGFGRTCLLAIGRYKRGVATATECGGTRARENGNGSLMRMLPGILYCYYRDLGEQDTKAIIDSLSSLTHRHEICRLGCWIYTRFLLSVIRTQNMEQAYHEVQCSDYSAFSEESIQVYQRILSGELPALPEERISSSGYVVDSLEASMWSVLNSDSFSSAVLRAINLGGDTDTIGALTGSIAGAIYEIPQAYTDRVMRSDYLEDLANKFASTLV